MKSQRKKTSNGVRYGITPTAFLEAGWLVLLVIPIAISNLFPWLLSLPH